MKYQVYEWYDKDGKLLYVGRSMNAMLRAADHKSKSSWYYLVAMCKVHTFDTLEESKICETVLISTLNPLFNITSNTPISTERVPVGYRTVSITEFVDKTVKQLPELRKLCDNLVWHKKSIDEIAAVGCLLYELQTLCGEHLNNSVTSPTQSGIMLKRDLDYKLKGRSLWNILQDVKDCWFGDYTPHKAAQKGLDIVANITGCHNKDMLLSAYKDTSSRLYQRLEVDFQDFGNKLESILKALP